MPQFRKKPIVIEAWPVDLANWEQLEALAPKIICAIGDRSNAEQRFVAKCFNIKTLEGTMTANEGDWIIKGVKGEFYPCSPDIFAATYEPVGRSWPHDPLI